MSVISSCALFCWKFCVSLPSLCLSYSSHANGKLQSHTASRNLELAASIGNGSSVRSKHYRRQESTSAVGGTVDH